MDRHGHRVHWNGSVADLSAGSLEQHSVDRHDPSGLLFQLHRWRLHRLPPDDPEAGPVDRSDGRDDGPRRCDRRSLSSHQSRGSRAIPVQAGRRGRRVAGRALPRRGACEEAGGEDSGEESAGDEGGSNEGERTQASKRHDGARSPANGFVRRMRPSLRPVDRHRAPARGGASTAGLKYDVRCRPRRSARPIRSRRLGGTCSRPPGPWSSANSAPTAGAV